MLPKALHSWLKKKALKDETTITQLIIDLIEGVMK